MRTIFLSIFWMAVLVAGCQSDNTSEKTDNAQELAPLAFTLYSDKTELFVEFKPLVVGSRSRFAAHFTKLGDRFAPLTDGKVTVSLIVKKKGIRNTVQSPSSPGIFRLALEPVKAGTGQLIFEIVTKEYTDKIIINDIPVYVDEKTALANQKEEVASGEISYLKEQAWKVDFANALVKRDAFYQIIRASGKLTGAPGDEITLVANAPGVVKFASRENAPGIQVQAGQALFTIAGGGMTNNNIDVAIRNMRAELAKAREDYDRARELIKDQLITRSEFTAARVRYETAQTEMNSLSLNYSKGGRRISSPISGFIKTIMVTEGAFVELGQPLAVVGKNQKLLLRAEVGQQYYSELSQVKQANFKTATTGSELFKTAELGGKLISVGRFTGDSPFVPVTFEISNPGNLVSGAVAEVFLQSAPIADAIAIPVSSLIEEQGNFYVYVQTAGESFQKRQITPGASNGLQMQVLSGLDEGERVVTKGANQIKLATMSGAAPAHGHEH